MNTTSFGMWLHAATAALRKAGADSPRLSAVCLLEFVTGSSRITQMIHPETPIEPDQLIQLNTLLHRREQGEPLAYLTGEREFYDRSFRVSRATLIPRPETELLIDTALNANLPGNTVFADLGCGSGCISVTLCAEQPLWTGICMDISPEALRVCAQNGRRHNVAKRLLPIQSDFTRPLFRPQSLDLAVSNPPYVPEESYREISREVRDYEPRTALVPPKCPSELKHGMEHLGRIAVLMETALKPGGLLLMEHGFDQGSDLAQYLKKRGWQNVLTLKDLAGLDRVVSARLPS